jgi:hypothetical protein
MAESIKGCRFVTTFGEVEAFSKAHPSRVMTAAIQIGDVANVTASRTVAQ